MTCTKNDNFFDWNDNSTPSSTFDFRKTIFLGGVHIKLTAINLYFIFTKVFGAVDTVRITSDKYNCPSGKLLVLYCTVP